MTTTARRTQSDPADRPATLRPDIVESDADLGVLSPADLATVDAWWRAANYLTVGQIYLKDNPLLHRPLVADDIKPRLLGHWGTSPGLSFVYAHLSRLIRHTEQSTIFLAGPGHGGAALTAASWLEGTYPGAYPEVGHDQAGLRHLVRQFSSPGGVPSHVGAGTPGSIHEGGELGYVLNHAFGAVMDNPDLLAVAVVGDGEAETAPLEGSWKGISFLNPTHDGAVLPVLHLNGAKISGPTVLARKFDTELRDLFRGHGYSPIEVHATDPLAAHHHFAQALAVAWCRIRDIKARARHAGPSAPRPDWPMIILRSPKGWTGPPSVDGVPVTGTFRSHQVPLKDVTTEPEHLRQLEGWLRGYRPEELFGPDGAPTDLVTANNPRGPLRMSANLHSDGGRLSHPLHLPDLHDFAVDVLSPGADRAESTRALGELLAEVYRRNPTSFRLFSPDELVSNRLDAVLDVSDRCWQERTAPGDEHYSRGGRLMEVLSEHSCHGWLEGYTLTGRHGLFATYEAFAMVSASQTVQHAKWLEEARALSWRAPVPSLNILLTSTAWRNDHNGFSHQGPGLIQNMITQRGSVARVFLPPDANSLLAVADHCLRSSSLVNLVVIDKQPQLQWLDLDTAIEHVRAGAGVWDWAGNESDDRDPDIVLACAGDVMTMETVAAAEILRRFLPQLRVRVVNVVDLMSLLRRRDHPHGMSDSRFRELFTGSVDVVFAFHGFPGAVHQLIHGRPKADRFHVRGFIEQGTTTTPFDMTVLNRVSRYHLVMDALNNAGRTVLGATHLLDWCQDQLSEHRHYVRENLQDPPAISDWSLALWP